MDAPVLGSPRRWGIPCYVATRGGTSTGSVPGNAAKAERVVEPRLAGDRTSHGPSRAHPSRRGRRDVPGTAAGRNRGLAGTALASGRARPGPWMTAFSPSAGTATSTGTGDESRPRAGTRAALLLAASLPAQRGTGQSRPLIRVWQMGAGRRRGRMNLPRRPGPRPGGRAVRCDRARCFDDATRCRARPGWGLCRPGDGGPLPELAATTTGDARRWLFAGETALAGAAAMFVWELTRKGPKPDNIPFEPEVRSLRRATGVGVRVAW